MELSDVITQRRSIRRFLDQPVSETLIKEIIATARWAPSWGNTQPWEIIAISGNALDRFKKANREAMASGQIPTPDVVGPERFPKALKARYGQVGRSVLDSLGIERNDVEGRMNNTLSMASVFDAPVMLVFVTDASLPEGYAMLDIGLILQNVCLLAHEKGLGTCIEAMTIQYPQIIREITSLPNDKRVVIGVALGWPDTDAPVNTFTRTRSDLDEILTLVK